MLHALHFSSLPAEGHAKLQGLQGPQANSEQSYSTENTNRCSRRQHHASAKGFVNRVPVLKASQNPNNVATPLPSAKAPELQGFAEIPMVSGRGPSTSGLRGLGPKDLRLSCIWLRGSLPPETCCKTTSLTIPLTHENHNSFKFAIKFSYLFGLDLGGFC